MLIVQDSYLPAMSLVVEQMLHLATLLVVYSTLTSVSCTLLSLLAAASSSLCNILLYATVVVAAHRERQWQLWLRYGAWRENGEERGTKIFQAFLAVEVFQQLKNTVKYNLMFNGHGWAGENNMVFLTVRKKPPKITIVLTAFLWPSKVLLLLRACPKTTKINYARGKKTLCFSLVLVHNYSANHHNTSFFQGQALIPSPLIVTVWLWGVVHPIHPSARPRYHRENVAQTLCCAPRYIWG
jgi:hypothetical protein